MVRAVAAATAHPSMQPLQAHAAARDAVLASAPRQIVFADEEFFWDVMLGPVEASQASAPIADE